MSNDTAFKEQCNSFIQWMHDDGKSKVYIKNMLSMLQNFASKYDEMNSINLNAFIADMNPTTANAYITRCKSFAKYHGIILDKVSRRTVIEDDPIALNSKQLKQLISAGHSIDPKIANVIIVLSETGMRINEFLQLKRDSILIDSDSNLPYVRVSSKGRRRSIPITQRCREAFDALELPFSYHERWVNRALEKAAKLAEISVPVTPHTMRRTFASIALNEKDMSVAHVCKAGGWANADVLIKNYLKPSVGKMFESMNT